MRISNRAVRFDMGGVAIGALVVVVVVMGVRGGCGISPRFGFEWRLDLAEPGTELLGHIGDHVVALNTQRCRHKLRRAMSVA